MRISHDEKSFSFCVVYDNISISKGQAYEQYLIYSNRKAVT